MMSRRLHHDRMATSSPGTARKGLSRTSWPALVLLGVAALVVSACNFTLAQDIKPPPGYVPPSPAPTLGPLSPAKPPNTSTGAAIFAEKCAPCHGERGLGDGEQGKQLPVSVAPLGLPETARPSTPARWFSVVTQGNLDRFMPPFSSLTDQERWDVVAYALTLHTTPEAIERGRTLFAALCPGCSTSFFEGQETMASVSNADLASIVVEGGQGLPAFGSSLVEEDVWAVAAYLRSLSFQVEPAMLAATPAALGTTTPQAAPSGEGSPEPGPEPTGGAVPAAGTVRGGVENLTGRSLPENLTVTLRAYEHEQDRSTGPQELFATEGRLTEDSTFAFEVTEMPEGRIFVAEVEFDDLTYQSEFVIAGPDAVEIVLEPIRVYATTTATDSLEVESLQVLFDYANEDRIQIFYVYRLRNTGTATIRADLDSAQNVPFVSFPPEATDIGYETMDDGARFVPLDGSFAMPPSAESYGLIAVASLPREKALQLKQDVLLPISTVSIFLPEGVRASGPALVDRGPQEIQGTTFNLYTSGPLERGAALQFELSGLPRTTAQGAVLSQKTELIIGVGALGAALVLAGAWLYLRERHRSAEQTEAQRSGVETAEDIMDTIVALDELHRAGKIPDEAYRSRRAELKQRLRDEL